MHKLNLFKNNFALPSIEKAVLFFFLKDFDDFNDPKFYNYFYFFKFFFGKKAFFLGYKSLFDLGKTTYNIKVQCFLSKKDIFNSILFLSNDVFTFLDSLYIDTKVTEVTRSLIVVLLKIKDMNVFVEKKTNVGLFYLKDPLNIQLFFFGTKALSTKFLLQCFKIFL